MVVHSKKILINKILRPLTHSSSFFYDHQHDFNNFAIITMIKGARATDRRSGDRSWQVWRQYPYSFEQHSLDTKTTRQTKYMIVWTIFISLSDPTPCGTDGACSREGPNGGVLGESKFGATPCICRVATGHILPHNFAAKETMVITGDDQHNNIKGQEGGRH
jgi:hypothetical protein